MSDTGGKSRRHYRGLFLVALTAFVAYNTFLPFRFYTTWSKIRRQFGEIETVPFMRNHHWVSYTDILGNILLFIPIGVAAWFYFYGCKEDRGRALLWSLGYGFLFSVFIEFTQIFLRYRVTSIHDVAMNSLGTFLGAWISAHIFLRYGRQGRIYFKQHLKKYPAALAALVLLGYILLYQLLPFDIRFGVHSLRIKSLDPLMWLAGRQRLEDFLILGALAFVLGVLIRYPVKDSRLRYLLNIRMLIISFVASEAVHLIMFSRGLDVYRVLALAGGLVAGSRFNIRKETALKAGLVFSIAIAAIYPFDFVTGPLPGRDLWPKMLTPFYYYYKTTSIWNLWDMAYSMLTGGMIVFLVRSGSGAGRRALFFSFLIIFLLEILQLFLKHRLADITDVLMAAAGAFILYLLWPDENRQARNPAARNNTEESPPATRA